MKNDCFGSMAGLRIGLAQYFPSQVEKVQRSKENGIESKFSENIHFRSKFGLEYWIGPDFMSITNFGKI